MSSSVDSSPSEVEVLKDSITKITEAFAGKLVKDVKSFTKNTRTTRDEIRAMIRCLKKCIENLHEAWTAHSGGSVLQEVVPRPVFDDARTLSGDELRSRARKLLKYLKTQTLEEFLNALNPLPNASIEEIQEALRVTKSSIVECDLLIDRVMYEGYDCRSSTEEEEEEDNDDESE